MVFTQFMARYVLCACNHTKRNGRRLANMYTCSVMDSHPPYPDQHDHFHLAVTLGTRK